MLRQRNYVLGPFGERRDPDREDEESMKQVFAEFALPHELFLEVAMRGGDDPCVDRDLWVPLTRRTLEARARGSSLG